MVPRSNATNCARDSEHGMKHCLWHMGHRNCMRRAWALAGLIDPGSGVRLIVRVSAGEPVT